MQRSSAKALKPPPRVLAGFTLIELLVVIAILAIPPECSCRFWAARN
jgi:prepilin-type N-terminal cleavage/methylation domain-containing protein